MKYRDPQRREVGSQVGRCLIGSNPASLDIQPGSPRHREDTKNGKINLPRTIMVE
jgi:hypothetical protein